MHEKKTATVLSVPIDVLTWEQALVRISSWAAQRESRYVCICNVHSVVTAGQDVAFGRVVKVRRKADNQVWIMHPVHDARSLAHSLTRSLGHDRYWSGKKAGTAA